MCPCGIVKVLLNKMIHSTHTGMKRKVIFYSMGIHKMEKGSVCMCVFFPLLLSFASARGGIVVNTLRDNDADSVVSEGRRFELGFFTPHGITSSDRRRYVGIWFYGSKPKVVVWVANRDTPLDSNNGVLAIKDGNLKVLDSKTNSTLWSTKIQPTVNASLVLMDSGNLILRGSGFNASLTTTQWQSFQNPTDTFLPGMSMSMTELSCWKSAEDPSKGNFRFVKDTEGHYIIHNLGARYWVSKELRYNFSPQRETDAWMEDLIDLFTILNFSMAINNATVEYDYAIAVMHFTGKLQYKGRNKQSGQWDLISSKPDNKCDVYEACGSFATCRSDSRHTCRCLPGFEPKSMDEWNSADYSSGCLRKSQICSQQFQTEEFLTVNMKPGMASYIIPIPSSSTGDECKTRCQQNCKCQAYSGISGISFRRSEVNCAIWEDELLNIWENADAAGPINIRMKHSEFERTKMDCNACGSNIVPYPLSTNSDCGDPMYHNFRCNDSSQLFFQPGDFDYIVTNIDSYLKTFTIKTNGSICKGNDKDAIQKLLKLEHSTFKVSSGCDFEFNEIDIQWEKPLEPICKSPKDCINWPNSSCNSSTDGTKRCFCKPSFEWTGISCQTPVDGGNPFHLEQRNIGIGIIVLVSIAGFIVISCLALYIYYTRRKLQSKKDQIATFWENQETTRLYESEKRIKDFMGSGTFGEDDRKAIEVPVFDLDTLLIATDNFSDANKIGRGGFGTVYKGLFPGGLRIAIKRLSQGSAQGVDEFKNEAILIAKLQHRNLVRLLGYCVAGEEKMLVYEYMPNRSLDSFIFDRTQCFLVNWEMRFNIIMGIARGLVYLHEDSRLRIIHRDMKTSNVLLDTRMNPKISDFGLARIFDGTQTETITTKRIVGTYGYMSPEYALDGSFSVKSDVFSFGIVVLEIVSGRRNTGFYKSKQALNLLGHVWNLWREKRALEIAEVAIRERCNPSDVVKCVAVGLLCVQEDPNDRPTMSTVAFMLSSSSDPASLPHPKKPAFIDKNSSPSTSSASSSGFKQEIVSNDCSLLEPR